MDGGHQPAQADDGAQRHLLLRPGHEVAEDFPVVAAQVLAAQPLQDARPDAPVARQQVEQRAHDVVVQPGEARVRDGGVGEPLDQGGQVGRFVRLLGEPAVRFRDARQGVEQAACQARQPAGRGARLVGLFQGVDELAEDVAGVVVRPRGHLQVAAVAGPARVRRQTEGPHEVRLAAARLAEQQERLAVGRRLRGGGPVEQAAERLARLAVDAVYVERVGRPDLVGVDDGGKHLGAVRGDEGGEARVEPGGGGRGGGGGHGCSLSTRTKWNSALR